ncbi:P-loop ATPase, Sll1717 family [Nocardioides bizhenqiangii]|uniref:ATP-binding protein n=1 Tax=Nocardioides bizhenqiangii TaxID=3095076 RepID=A0ABZ0ZMF2_9ACTN|nr:hypothetical protein [Nocardioides sp. HM61]WQQ24893.1 hypothetical protein SHK19_13050 [Nocardioides sp. HM61]
MPQPPLKELHFGHLDASEEAIDEPDLLMGGFYDYREAAFGITTGRAWLILGPKGAGKSAVLEHIRLSWAGRWDHFFSAWNLASFPVNDVTALQIDQAAGPARNQAAWEFLLLLRVIDSLNSDEGLRAPASFGRLVKELNKAGLLQGDWARKVAQWSKQRMTFDAKVIGGEAERDVRKVTALEVSEALKAEMRQVRTESRHLIALDGLDSFFFEAEDEWASLSGLTQAIKDLNRNLRQWALPVNIVAAMRSDIFDVLPGAETNKLKPHSVHLDWSAGGIGGQNHLWALATKKAQVTRPEVTNLVKQYFNAPIAIGPHTEMAEFLLDNTRLLPRDMIALLGFAQRNYGGSKQMPEDNAKAAVQQYAEEYFVGEIFDNLAGVLPLGSARKVASFRDALRTLPTRRFDFAYLETELQGELERNEVRALLRQMFETGGVGVRNPSGYRDYTDFVFRKVSGAGFTIRYEFILHDALVRAWNRPWS